MKRIAVLLSVICILFTLSACGCRKAVIPEAQTTEDYLAADTGGAPDSLTTSASQEGEISTEGPAVPETAPADSSAGSLPVDTAVQDTGTAAAEETTDAQTGITENYNYTTPSASEVGYFEKKALYAALNVSPYTDGNGIDPKEAVKGYYFADFPGFPYSETKEINRKDAPESWIKILDGIMYDAEISLKSVPADLIAGFFDADSLDLSCISDWWLLDDRTIPGGQLYQGAAKWNAETGTIDYIITEAGAHGYPGFDCLPYKPYETSYEKNGASDYTYTVKYYTEEKPEDMTGVSETTLYDVEFLEDEFGDPGKVTRTHTEKQFKKQFANTSLNVKEKTGYVKTWKVNAIHVDGSFRIKSITVD